MKAILIHISKTFQNKIKLFVYRHSPFALQHKQLASTSSGFADQYPVVRDFEVTVTYEITKYGYRRTWTRMGYHVVLECSANANEYRMTLTIGEDSPLEVLASVKLYFT